eukprot:CAMPEP_0197649798 /NCGR_PEP_ID=MMETSP1338-20131121/29789_1 /TAXON_ID=43686 ORGANISM="Pelagodinium beii, Strain RCC1491" /NCGR_SAMPLE_ID=MMETSP1338 /ASSEMBLY_ACC=CAM_ASM_000754 /LENGTH=96 /DNA_ID=CAMNT_0043224073 /DNA_START=67 /DNA_END=354 /DNA_ORIENTATION=+
MVGACAAATIGSAFVAPMMNSQSQDVTQRSGYLRASTASKASSGGMGSMTAMGALAGLAAAGVAGKRASKKSVSMQAVGVGINGFGRIGRQVARIA